MKRIIALCLTFSLITLIPNNVGAVVAFQKEKSADASINIAAETWAPWKQNKRKTKSGIKFSSLAILGFWLARKSFIKANKNHREKQPMHGKPIPLPN